MDGGAWWAIVHVVTKSQTHLSNFTNVNNILKSGIPHCSYPHFRTQESKVYRGHIQLKNHKTKQHNLEMAKGSE